MSPSRRTRRRASCPRRCRRIGKSARTRKSYRSSPEVIFIEPRARVISMVRNYRAIDWTDPLLQAPLVNTRDIIKDEYTETNAHFLTHRPVNYLKSEQLNVRRVKDNCDSLAYFTNIGYNVKDNVDFVTPAYPTSLKGEGLAGRRFNSYGFQRNGEERHIRSWNARAGMTTIPGMKNKRILLNGKPTDFETRGNTIKSLVAALHEIYRLGGDAMFTVPFIDGTGAPAVRTQIYGMFYIDKSSKTIDVDMLTHDEARLPSSFVPAGTGPIASRGPAVAPRPAAA